MCDFINDKTHGKFKNCNAYLKVCSWLNERKRVVLQVTVKNKKEYIQKTVLERKYICTAICCDLHKNVHTIVFAILVWLYYSRGEA